MVQQGLVHQVPHLRDEPEPRTPGSRPSVRPLPTRLSSTSAPVMGASAGPRVELNQLPGEVGQDPLRPWKVDGDPHPVRKVDSDPHPIREVDSGLPRARQEALLLQAKVEGPRPQVEVGGHQPPAEVPQLPPRGVPLICPPVARERATATGPAGISWPCRSPRAGSLSPRGLLS